MGKFPLTGCWQKNWAIFFGKTGAITGFKLNFIKTRPVNVGQNQDLVCYRKKHSFRQGA